MANIKSHKLEESIKKIIISAGLATLSSKKVRVQLEEKFGSDFTSRKKEIDDILMRMVEEANRDGDDEKSSESSNEENSESASESDSDGPKQKSTVNATKNPTSRKRTSIPSSPSKSKKAKKEVNETGEKVKKKTGFGREMVLSEQLTTLLGTDKLSRGDVVKQIYALVKDRDLLDPSNKQYVLCDEQLAQIFGVRRFRAFGMMKYLKNHIKDPKDVI